MAGGRRSCEGVPRTTPATTKVLLALATVSSPIMPGVLAGRLRDRLVQAGKRLCVMAWHLGRLGKQA